MLIYGDFVYFYGFLGSHSRGSGAGAPNMDHVIHQNDHLVKPYHIQKKKRFRYQGNPPKCQFRVIWSCFGNFQGPISWDEAGTHDISHVIVIHQNDHLATAGKTNGSGGLVTRPAIYVCNLELITDMFNTRWCHKNIFLVNIITSFCD